MNCLPEKERNFPVQLRTGIPIEGGTQFCVWVPKPVTVAQIVAAQMYAEGVAANRYDVGTNLLAYLTGLSAAQVGALATDDFARLSDVLFEVRR